MISNLFLYNIWLGLIAGCLFFILIRFVVGDSPIQMASYSDHRALKRDMSFSAVQLFPVVLGLISGGALYLLFLLSYKWWIGELNEKVSAEESAYKIVLRGLSLLLIPGLNVCLTLTYVDSPLAALPTMAFIMLSSYQIWITHVELGEPGLIASPVSRLLFVMGTVLVSVASYNFVSTLCLYLLEARPEKDLIQLFVYVISEHSYQLPEDLSFTGTLRTKLITSVIFLNTIITYYLILKSLFESCVKWLKWRLPFFRSRVTRLGQLEILRGAYHWASAKGKTQLAIKYLYELKALLEFRQLDDFYKPMSTLLGEMALAPKQRNALSYSNAFHEVQESFEHHSELINESMRLKSLKLYALTVSPLIDQLEPEHKIRVALSVVKRTQNRFSAIDAYHKTEINIVHHEVIKPIIPLFEYAESEEVNHFLYAWIAKVLTTISFDESDRLKELSAIHEGFRLLSARSANQSALNHDICHYEIIYLAYMIINARAAQKLEGSFIEGLHNMLNQKLNRLFQASEGKTQNTKTWQLQLGLALISAFQIHTHPIEINKSPDHYLVKALSWLYEAEYREFNILLSKELLEEARELPKKMERYQLDESAKAMVEKWIKLGINKR